MAYPKVTVEEEDRIIELHRQGCNRTTIAERVNRCESTVANALFRRLGLMPGTYGGPRKYKTKRKRSIKECLKCEKKFMSDGIYNRICGNCRESNANIDETMLSHERPVQRPSKRGAS